MQFFAVFLALAAFLVVVAQAQPAAPVQFALQMEGHLNRSSPYNIAIKGNSQTVTTLIKPKTDAVTFSVQPILGAYAEVLFNLSTTAKLGGGTVSFGTHLSREHTVDFYAMSIDSVIPGAQTGEQVVFNSYHAKGGSGTFEKSHGSITITSIIHGDDSVSAFLHGVIFLPN